MQSNLNSYKNLAPFYDSAMGNRKKTINLLRKIIRKHHSGAKDILELACGTGEILNGLSREYEVTGLDSSRAMLAMARKKAPQTKFFLASMESFNLKKRYDVIFLVFDSINHLLTFPKWQSTFKHTFQHLNSKGLFIFDINTLYKLKKLTKLPSRIQNLGSNDMEMNIIPAGQRKVEWQIKIFEGKGGKNTKTHQTNILTTSFPLGSVLQGLKKYFKILVLFDQDYKKPHRQSRRIYFVCQKKIKGKG